MSERGRFGLLRRSAQSNQPDQIDEGRRLFVMGAASTAVLLATGAIALASDEGGLQKRLEFDEWKKQRLDETDPQYSPLWEAGLARVGKQLPSELVCEHRGNSPRKVLARCADYNYNYIESDWRSVDGETAWAMHQRYSDRMMEFAQYQNCMSTALLMQPPHQMLEKLDIKDKQAYKILLPQIQDHYEHKQVIVNTDPFNQFGYDVSEKEFHDACGQYPFIIWSIGYDGFTKLGNDPEKDKLVKERIIRTHQMAKGNFTLPVNALHFDSVFRKDPHYFDEMRDAGVMFTIYYGNGERVPNGVMDAIMHSGIPPWQVICDFK